MPIDHSQFAVPASAFVEVFERCDIEYVTTVPDMLQIEDVVMVFATTVTSQQKAAYGQAVKNAMR